MIEKMVFNYSCETTTGEKMDCYTLYDIADKHTWAKIFLDYGQAFKYSIYFSPIWIETFKDFRVKHGNPLYSSTLNEAKMFLEEYLKGYNFRILSEEMRAYE